MRNLITSCIRAAAAAAIWGLLLCGTSTPSAAGYNIVKLVDGMSRPDLPCCVPFYIFYTPVIAGDHVAFLSRQGPPDGVWSGNISTRSLTKLAGLETPAPGGTGNFSAFYGGAGTPISIGGNTVTFFAADAAGKIGIYSVPVTGGIVRRIATTAMTAPDGSVFSELRRAKTNGSRVVFFGSTAAHPSGIYTATIAGRQLAKVIDNATTLDARDTTGILPGYFGLYDNPVYAQTSLYFQAWGTFDPVSAPNAIFRHIGGAYYDMADNITHLQSLADSHVRILQISAAAASNRFAFLADQPSAGISGIFELRSKDFAAKFVTTNDIVPGTARKFNSFVAMAYDDPGVAFVATVQTKLGTDQSIYYAAGTGQPIVKVAPGSVYYLPLLGDRAVSGGRIAFMDGSNFADTVYVAIPAP